MAEQPPPSQTPPAQTPPPQWAPPQQQPAWGQPPPGAWGQPGYAAPPPRPIGVTLGSIWLIVVGILFTLGGAACGILGGGVSQLGDTSGLGAFVGGSLLVLGVIALIIGVLQIVGGAGALGGRGWGRWIGIVLSIIFTVFGVLGLLGSLGSLGQEGVIPSAVTTLIITVAYGFTAWSFISAGAYFSRR